ncbi:FMN-dependent NADH-azoreductase [Bradyrhizobium sp. 2TAF24]|uniref:FMN-dependent NADH-azoreductase n=1 Tax=Bradyrhizobium sp. 2TAF24 TaxID=3233011 RepID=UPI003F903013
MRILKIVTSPRGGRSVSTAVVDAFLAEYQETIAGSGVIDTLDVWSEALPDYDADAIGAKYKGVSGEAMTPAERATWDRISALALRFQNADRIVLGVPMWNFSFPYKLKQLIDLACQRGLLFTFDGKTYGPLLNIDKAFVVYTRGQSEEAGLQTALQPGFDHVAGYVEFWLRFIGVRNVTAMTVEHTWDGRARDMIDDGKRRAAALARQF